MWIWNIVFSQFNIFVAWYYFETYKWMKMKITLTHVSHVFRQLHNQQYGIWMKMQFGIRIGMWQPDKYMSFILQYSFKSFSATSINLRLLLYHMIKRSENLEDASQWQCLVEKHKNGNSTRQYVVKINSFEVSIRKITYEQWVYKRANSYFKSKRSPLRGVIGKVRLLYHAKWFGTTICINIWAHVS